MQKAIFFLGAFLFISLHDYGQQNEWTWMKGDNNATVVDSSHPVYGPIGASSTSFRPGTRSGATMWTSADGAIWLFGGSGYGNSLNYGRLNDLWRYNPVTNEWTWVKGDNTPNNYGVYTNPTASLNKPGGRDQAVGWVDANGDFWLFGGYGYAASGTYSSLNDLWKYTVATNTWTFIKGDNIIDVIGVYSNANTSLIKPGGRYYSTGWRVGGNLYLFGGWGRATTATPGYLNDLWRYTIATNTWTWIKGDNITYSPGVYSNPSPLLNKPGAREAATSWVDVNGIAWLFGGNGYAASSNSGFLNDLWKYDATLNTWTWVKGDNVRNILGVYGSLGVPDVNNKPGSRHSASGWADNAGNLWLFGGTNQLYLSDNDLWRYNILANTWTWMKGASYSGANGQYGIQGIPDDNNFPGARSGMSSVKDAAGNFWLFGGGGKGYPYNNSNVSLNELWKFNPVVNQWTWVRHNNEVVVYYPGNYGIQGVSNLNNKPGGKSEPAYCSDGNGNHWFFGGWGNGGTLNDLWKYNESDNSWTYMKGDSVAKKFGVYGSLGQSNTLNKPGSRSGSVMWKSGSDTLWLFGGIGYGNSEEGLLNDLWCYKISSNTWTWVKGDSSINKDGVYNQTPIQNKPGSRVGAVSWTDATGSLWLFGGNGYVNSVSGELNDLWKYNVSTNIWTWVKGDNAIQTDGIYGEQGVPDINNKPGSRFGATTWYDNNSLWLFGGFGYSETTSSGILNDLWKYDILTNEWTWFKGDKFSYVPGVYGTIGVPGALNKPGTREGGMGWNDGFGNLWLFGGNGIPESGFGNERLNDLWKYNIASNQWTWMKGDNTASNLGEYGTVTVSDPSNKPGGRFNAAAWKGSGSKIWLFGGYGFGSTNPETPLNDLWKYETPCTGQLLLTPLTGTLCYSGSSVLLTVSGGTSYVWYKDGIVIPGQTGNSYTAITPGSYNVKGNVGSCLNVFSNEVFIQTPSIPPGLGGTGVYCEGDFVNVGIPQTEVGQDYTWLRGSLRVLGPLGGNGGNQSLQFPMSASYAGTYIVESTKPGCDTVFSNYVYVGFARIEGLTITNLCPISSSSATVTFTWDRVGPSQLPQLYEYAVTLNPFPPAAGTVTSANTITRNISAGLTHRIYVRARCGADLTNFGEWAELIFQSPASVPTLAITPTSASICQGGSQLLTVIGSGPFQWYKDGTAISGETGSTYLVTQAGGYSVRAILLNCETVFESNLVVVTISPPLTSTTNLSVCTNQLPYIWNGNTYNTAGTYNVTLQGSNGCDSIATLNLAINPTSSSITNLAVCSNLLPYSWNGNSYNAGGSYIVTLTGSNNCDSIATLNLSVNPVSTSTTNISICTNQLPYSWNGNNYNAGGTYNVTLPGTNGCDSIATLNLTVNTVLTSTTNATVCTNQLPFIWNGNNYNTAGSFNVTLVSQSGCDSIATLNLTINPVLTSTTNASACSNQLPYNWNGNAYNTAGTYTITLVGSNGCDSIATLNLTINPTSSSITNVAVCSNLLPYSWNGNSYNAGGSYNVTLTGSNNCDSIATLNLSVNPVSTSSTTISICTNQLPYNWNGNVYNAGGVYNVTLPGTNGCDSIATLNLTVNTVLTSTTNASVCANQLPFVWNGNNYNTAGSFNVTLVSQSGCDSIATLNLTINPLLSSTTNASTCSNQLPYIWNGNNYNAAGTYTITLLGSNGCDSIATLNLTINSTSSSITNVSTCSNQLPYSWNGNNYSSAGIYNVTLTGSNNCDSIATLNLSVNSVSTSTTNVSICTNQLPYNWNSNSYNAAGIYNVTLIAANGCDSIATLNLAVSTVLTSTTNASICANQLPFVWNGNNYNTAGTFNVILVSQSGCDSIATLNLSVNPILTSTTNAAVCSNQLPYSWNGNNYSTAGTYNITLLGSNGCDSIATLNLSINSTSSSITNAAICSNQLPYNWNGNTYGSSGIYNVILIGTNGCDSIATLSLTVNAVQTSTTNVSICNNQLPYTWNGNNYNLAGIYNVILAGSNGCDSIATLNLSIGAVLTSTTNVTICSNQLPFSWNGNNYTTAGSFNVTLVSQTGCDSIATLNLGVIPVLTSVTNITRCANQLPYLWNGNNYTATGIYNITLAGSNGCDSIASLNLTVNPVLTSITNASICANQTPYTWNGNNYSTSGIYTATLNGSNGCDSIATLNLDIKPILTSVSNIEICTNQLPYSWNGNNYNVGGSYNVTLAGSNGCDSIATLNLAIKPVATSTTSISICANQLPFNWNGNSYTSSGSYNVILTGANNCDSTATLILTVNTLPTGSISPGNATICVGSSQILTVSGGVSYQWFLNGTPVNGATADALTVTTQGVYSVQLTAANGCKAMASNTANIQVLQKPIVSFDFSAICQNETTIFNNRSTAGSSGTINWRWNFGDNSSSSLFAPTHVYTQPGSYTVELIATPAACLQLADTVKKTITVITATPGIRYDNVRVLKNTPYTLSARNIGVQYVWQPGTALNSSTIQNPVVTTTADRQYLVKITTAAGCLVTDTLLVQAFDKADIYVPKAFTPNNNNANDKLRPLGVSVFSIDYFRVYNRWGQLVYQTQTIGEGWDGNYKNVPQPTETYTWVFAGKSQDGTIIKASGKTVLIR